MENYLIAAAIASLAPSLVIKGCSTLFNGVWYVGNSAIYGRQKSEQELTQELIIEMEKKFEQQMIDISNRERNIDMKLDKLLKQNYSSINN